MDELLTDWLRQHAQTRPNAPAASEGDVTLSYADLESRVLDWRGRLVARGVKPGDRVAVMTTPSIDYYVSLLATIGMGAIWTGLNPRHQFDEFAYAVADAEPTLILYRPEFEGRGYTPEFDRLRRDFPRAHIESLPAFARGEGPTAPSTRAHADQAAILVYTSGSTGRPKGAQLSHEALVLGAKAQLRRWALDRVDPLCYFPINHVACSGDVAATTLVAGGHLTFHDRFDAKRALAAYASGSANIVLAVPTMLQMLMAAPEFTPASFSKIDLIVWGGAPLPASEIAKLRAMGLRLATLYGMTEAAANTTYTSEDADDEALFETVGKPLPEFPTRIVADGKVCGVNEPGEIQHKLLFSKLGYWRRPEATAEVITGDGWYKSGDIGVWREDGAIKFVGRIKEMFKSGGYNIYPREVEIALEQSDDIAEAVVVPIADPLYQEVGVAFLRPTTATLAVDAIKAFARSKLANYKIPKHYVVCEAFPLLPIGKVDRQALKERARQMFAKSQGAPS